MNETSSKVRKPRDTCVRISECDGVDEDCPRRKSEL